MLSIRDAGKFQVIAAHNHGNHLACGFACGIRRTRLTCSWQCMYKHTNAQTYFYPDISQQSRNAYSCAVVETYINKL
jgi:hypothetical protein